jgi:hypothetical protein
MTWSVIYLVLAVLMAVAGIWNLAQRKSFFLSAISLVWILVVLFRFYFPGSYNFTVLPDLTFASLLQYVVIPILLILLFFAHRKR